MKSLLIKDTTKKEREEIVRHSLGCADGCETCSGCALGAGDPYEMYRPYIEGECEIRDITMAFRSPFEVH